ncbi:MAG: hypothetical protein PHV13_04075 [Candidatus ainarchaeum sp.]|nr:hypothetical protein [Candidatus ainarchaeum sp.]
MAAITPTGSVQRLDFGRRLGTDAHGARRPLLSSGVLTDIHITPSPGISRASLVSAARELMSHDLELDKGPYADAHGAVAWLLNDVKSLIMQAAEGKPTPDALLRCVMDVLRPYRGAVAERQLQRKYVSESHHFLLSEDAVIDDSKPACAGELLTDIRRQVVETATGRNFTLLTSVMEPFFIATSLLRRLEMDAYPALASVEPEAGKGLRYEPVMAIVSLDSTAPLRTFPLLGQHPAMDSLILIGDDAMQGVAWAIVARKLVNQAALEIVGPEGASPSHNIRPDLDAISDALFECYKAWPGSFFIEDALGFMRTRITETLDQIGMLALDRDIAIPRGLRQTVFSTSRLVFDFVHPIAASKTEDYVGRVLRTLNARIKETLPE